jgi:hypothetical protein
MPCIFFAILRMGKRDDTEKVTYLCNTCKQLFFSYSEVVYHKGMTGHGEYTKREKRSSNDG